VEECQRPAAYEVYLYDYYEMPDGDEEFFEQDFTCPFICEEHMQENEALARGFRRPRGVVRYPYTNRGGAQGYTKYQPLSEVFSTLYKVSISPPGALLTAYRQVNEELIRRLARRPELLREVDPRKFEEIVADIFADLKFQTQLTPRTRDGGRDVLAVRSETFGTSLYLIECKRYDSSCKVGVEFVRSLAGVVFQERATHGILATTSSFTKDAIDWARPLKYQLSLRDFEAVTSWLVDYAKRRGDA
jgi:hypothetical protein